MSKFADFLAEQDARNEANRGLVLACVVYHPYQRRDTIASLCKFSENYTSKLLSSLHRDGAIAYEWRGGHPYGSRFKVWISSDLLLL